MKHSLLTFLLAVTVATAIHAADSKLWYDKPAGRWEQEALPIGNGRLGAMVFGKTEVERIQFNEDSLWIGDERDTGAYQAFGDLFIDLDGISAVTNYRRELDIERAVHTVSYSKDGVNYRREYLASHPAGVMAFRFTADKPGAFTGSISMTDAHKGAVSVDAEGLTVKGNTAGYILPSSRNGIYGNAVLDSYAITLDYEARALVRHDGGTLEAKDGKLLFTKADTLTIYLDAGTDYINQREKKWRGEHPHRVITERLAKAAAIPYPKLLSAHLRDYQSLFNRVSIDLGASGTGILPVSSGSDQPQATGKMPVPLKDLPTDRRLIAYRGVELGPIKAWQPADDWNFDDTSFKGVEDPEFEALFFQYGRYLMIASSRRGSLPANLQGLWNESNMPRWRCDYHSDVNVQMNYWFVDAANLSECFLPYSEWLHSVIPVRRDDTKKTFGVRGWATHSENGIFGGSTYLWVPGDAAWLAQNIWDHYAFTRDRQYLQTRAYPIIKELCEFWEDSLKEGPGGKLVSPKSQSPEHGPVAEGNSYEQQLVYDLFTNYIEASKDLGVDEDLIHDITLGLEPEDGVIWVYGLDNNGILAFTDDGIEEVQRLLDEYRHDTTSKP